MYIQILPSSVIASSLKCFANKLPQAFNVLLSWYVFSICSQIRSLSIDRRFPLATAYSGKRYSLESSVHDLGLTQCHVNLKISRT
jgi:hypothetical protein